MKLIICLLGLLLSSVLGEYSDNYHCTAFSFERCGNYKATYLPNYLNESSIDNIKESYYQLIQLKKNDCAHSFELFLCAFLFPVCSEGKKVGPCKSFCKQIVTDCFDTNSISIQYCDPLKDNGICIEDLFKDEKCPKSLKVPTSLDYSIQLSKEPKGIISDCGFPCDRHLYDYLVPKNFIKSWIGFWSGLCALSTLFTILTFLIDVRRFQYPERPIVYLSGCYLTVSLAYIFGISFNNNIICSGPFSEIANSSRVLVQGTKHEACIVSFMLIYFFSMSGLVWWVVLTITWYLAAKCHWAHEAIARHAQYWHFVAWAFPAAQTIGILAWGKIDADPFSGVCFTGLTDTNTLQIFIIGPMLIYLLIGNCFLITGFVSLFRIRRTIKDMGNKTDDLEKFIRRIGIFSVFYIVPAFVLLACYTYDSLTIEKRTLRWYRRDICPLLTATGKNECSPDPSEGPFANQTDWNDDMSDFVITMLKYLMNFVVGVTIGIWTWSGKTLSLWQTLFSRKTPQETGVIRQQAGVHLLPSSNNWLPAQNEQMRMKNLSIL